MPSFGGGGDKCPKCNGIVYFSEAKRALGRQYHSTCLKCSSCGKVLDSVSCNEHDNDLYCGPCLRQNFGSQGCVRCVTGSALNTAAGDWIRTTSTEANMGHLARAGALTNVGRGADVCPRCRRSVYMAEKVVGAGQSFHKSCFLCLSCNKSLNSMTVCQHDNDVYCKGCYGRLFGPKGYGFAGGASGLSMGPASKVVQDYANNVSRPGQAQPVDKHMSCGGDQGVRESCHRCSSAVYFAERVACMGKVYHKLCYRCKLCNRCLDSTLLTEHDDNIYCKSCYGRQFGPHGFGHGSNTIHAN